MESECALELSGLLLDDTVRMCDTARVVFAVAASCPVRPVHLVIVQPTRADRPDWMITVARASLDILEGLSEAQAAKVGVVHYSTDGARVMQTLSGDLARARRLIAQPEYGAPIANNYANLAARRAVDMLDGASYDPLPWTVILFFALAKHPVDGNHLMQAAATLNSSDSNVLVGCPSRELGIDYCIYPRRMVENPSNYGHPATRSALSDRFARLLSNLFDGLRDITDVVASHDLPPEVRLLAGSASEPPREIAQPGGGTRLEWHWQPAGSMQPVSVTYSLEPQRPGRAEISSTMILTDRLGSSVVLPGVVGTVDIYAGCPSPTPLPSSTPQWTATPPTTTATPSPSATPTVRAPQPLYLPIALKEQCRPDVRLADAVVVIDASTSMLEEVRPGYSKRAAAADAVLAFVELLGPDDQAALVWFNDIARLEQELTSDKQLLQAALQRIEDRQGTRLHLGIREARQELMSNRRRPENQPVLILLTDGKANPEGPEVAVAEAQLAKDADVTIFTIGLGDADNLDDTALRQIASRPEYYYRTPDAEQLRAVYRAIAGVIPCPRNRYWGRR